MADEELPQRRSIRIPEYDYSTSGAYFITICSYLRKCVFGQVKHDEIQLNNLGLLIQEEWQNTSLLRKNIALDKWVIMPNHFHGIIWIDEKCRGTACCARNETTEQFGRLVSGSLPAVIRSFKSAVSKRINELRHTPGTKVWQRNYYEHVIRNEDDLTRIRQYIIDNPAKWANDEENPANLNRAKSKRA
ncbi:MAG: transposase [Planctomycetes bacterium]|nr:transposase [Planctomycetota bacterium]